MTPLRFVLVAVASLGAGCATGRTHPTGPDELAGPAPKHGASSRPHGGQPGALPEGHPPIAERETDTPELDAPGPMAEAWRRPFILLDGRSGRRLDLAALNDRIRDARVIYVGERHDRPAHHQVQLEVIARAARLGSTAVGLEMVQRPFQTALDRFARDGDEAAVQDGTEWAKRWGFDFRLYRPILRLAAKKGLPLVALNAPKELTRAIAAGGVSGLDPALGAAVPELDLDDVAHRARVRLVWAAHVAPHGEMGFENFYAAQVTWDETMAETVAGTLAGGSGPDRMVVLAGAGHVRYAEGIPQRAARRGATPYLSILPVDGDEAVDLIASGVADILWVFDGDGASTKVAHDLR